MKPFDSRSDAIRMAASSKYEEDSDFEENGEDDWEEAIKHNSVFYGDNVIIALICKEKTCPHCESRLIKRTKWKIATRKGNRWTVMEEHPFNCDVDEVFGEYGLPSEFTPISGYYRDDEAIIPCKRR
jgi:hypothetical protein